MPLTRKQRLTFEDFTDYPFAAPSLPGRMFAALRKEETRFDLADEIERRFRPRILVESISTAKARRPRRHGSSSTTVSS